MIKIKATGLFNKTHFLIWLKKRLNEEFIISLDESNPDYLIYNAFNDEYKNPKYKNIVKIAIYTENLIPDLNESDYCIAHYHINYLDRYFKYNIFLWRNFTNFDNIRKNVLKSKKKKFCAAVISNCRAKFRLKFINILSRYKKVDIGGYCKNNINKTIINKIQFLSEYKFSIAMENSEGDGYISEKIYQSFLSGTIPIYYGDYMIDEFINPKTYILIKGENDIKTKIDYIIKIDKDDKLYNKILKEKPLIDDNFMDKIDKNEIKLFLTNIFKQDKNKAFRRDDIF